MRRLPALPIVVTSCVMVLGWTVSRPFMVEAVGGMAFDTHAGEAGWRRPGGDTPVPGSDATLMERFRELDGDAVLAKIARLPVREWNYKAQGAAVRHVGPTAQDFHAAFGLGDDPLRISTIDADGVALRAIQALEARSRGEHDRLLEDTQSLADEINSLVRENADRTAEVATLKQEIAALRAEMSALKALRR